MSARTEGRVVSVFVLAFSALAGAVAGYVGSEAALGFVLGNATALLFVAGSAIVAERRQRQEFDARLAEGWAVVERCKAQLA